MENLVMSLMSDIQLVNLDMIASLLTSAELNLRILCKTHQYL